MTLEGILTVKELTVILKVSKDTIYRMVREKKIPYTPIRGQIRFVGPKIAKWLEEQEGMEII